jgi:drug/metabolite transporter (DMT)-like permease
MTIRLRSGHTESIERMSSTLKKGVYLAFLTALISGVSNFVNKIAVDVIKPPLVFTAEKNAIVGLLIIGILIATWKWKKIKNLTSKQLIYLILIGVIGGSLPFYLFFTGLSQIPAINGVIINKTLVIWVAILAIPFLKEKMSVLQIAAVALLFCSNALIGGFTKFQFSTGELFVLMATILWAIEHVLAKKILPTVDPDIVTAARMGFGSLILLGAASILAPTALVKSLAPSSTQMFWMTATVILLLGYVTAWYRALKFAPVTVVASILVSATLVTNVLSAIFVTHAWNIQLGIQAFFTILGVVLLWLAIARTKTSPKLSYEKS